MDEHTFILLYKSMVCPHVEFANSVWCPYNIGDLKEIEKLQKRAAKLVTHAHTRITAIFPGPPGYAGTRKVNQSGLY